MSTITRLLHDQLLHQRNAFVSWPLHLYPRPLYLRAMIHLCAYAIVVPLGESVTKNWETP